MPLIKADIKKLNSPVKNSPFKKISTYSHGWCGSLSWTLKGHQLLCQPGLLPGWPMGYLVRVEREATERPTFLSHIDASPRTIEYYAAIEKKEILPLAKMQIDTEGIMLSEMSETNKHKIPFNLIYMRNLK